jgi:hypothetical protein
MFPSSDPFVCSPLPSNGSRGRHFFRGPAVPHLRRYYGLIRSLPIHRPGSPVALDPELPPQIARRKLEGFPKFLENPFESVPRARDSGGPGHPRLNGCPDSAFHHFKNLGIRNVINFGAESSKPTFSLSTLLPQAVARRAARLATGPPATALTGLDLHQLDSFRKVSSAHMDSPSPKLCLAR